MTSRLLFRGAAAVLLGSAVFVCADDRAGAPPTVVADTVKTVSEAAPRRYVGAVEPIRHVDIMPRITGTLLKVNFTEGEMVREGDLLYELEDTTYRAAVDGLKAQKEAQEVALRYADKEFRRNRTLLESKAVAETSYDKALFEIDTARANLKQLKASLTDAENTLSYTKIYAPVTGRIGKSIFTEGNLITPSGGKLTDVEMIAPIYVRFSLSERVFRRDFGGMEGIRDRARVRVQLADGTLYGETAKITLIDNKVDSGTNTITLWATFENKDRQLLPGSFATVLISAASEKTLTAVVPSALIMEEGGYYIYVLDEANKISRRNVVPGRTAPDGLQIIAEGLKPGERIVSDGMNKVRPGMTVTPVPAESVK